MDPDKTLSEAVEAFRRGALGEAEKLCRSILQSQTRHFPAAIVLGDVLLRSQKPSDALAAYEYAAQLIPGHAMPFTRAAILRFRMAYGAPPAPRRSDAEPSKRRVQMTSLGSSGRFGNQLLQYAFIRLYAEKHDLTAELPDWIGRDLFDLDDPFPSVELPRIDENDEDLFALLDGRSGRVLADVDISGYFCGNTSRWGARQQEFRALFAPGRKIRPSLDRALARLKSAGNTIVAIHLRQADFGYGRFWIAPVDWYLPWLRALWPALDSPVLYVATDRRGLVGRLAEFSPFDAARAGAEIPGAGFIVDHHILRHANHVAISNSSFSFSAAMLNTDARTFVRPHPNRRELVPFDPWGAEVLLDPVLEPGQVSAAEKALLKQRFGPGDSVVHLGRSCSAWTNLARSVHPELRILELDASSSLDQFRKESGFKHVRHVVLEFGDSLSNVIAGALETLRRSRIDFLHFRVEGAAAEAPPSLANNGYVLFRLTEGPLEGVAERARMSPGSYVAVQERLLPLLLGRENDGLNIPLLCWKHGIRVRGVLHVGAHLGQELAIYDAMHVERTVFVEANPEVHARLAEAMRGRSDVITVNRAISDKPGKVTLHLASFDMSSSLLAMAGHREVYPQIVPSGAVDVEATTLDALLKELQLPPEGYNFLTIDVQGAEAMVLKGATEVLRHIEAINVEVNFAELYRDCAQIEDIDDMLKSAGFARVATMSVAHPSWGDAFYVRRRSAAGFN
jgi:FkbM family methyltransferase